MDVRTIGEVKSKLLYKVKDKLEDIGLWFEYSWIGRSYKFICRIPRNLKTIIDYIPILWDSYDFDHGYLEELIVFKLKRMEKFFRNHGMCMNSVYYANEMKFVIDCLETAGKCSDVLEDQHRKINEKYGDIKIESRPSESHPGFFEVEFKRTKCNTEEEKKVADEELFRIMRLEEEIKDESKKMAFNIIKERIDHWWD